MRSRGVIVVALCLGLVCCRSLAPARFAAALPEFQPDRFFEGTTHSWGVMETPSGAPTRRFTTIMEGVRTGDTLVLTQHFRFDDGRTEERIWHVRRLDAHRYEGTAADVIGTARGQAYGNAFRWDYTLALSPSIFSRVRVRQWMYLQEGGETMVNRVAISKLGVQVGQTTEYFRRGPGD